MPSERSRASKTRASNRSAASTRTARPVAIGGCYGTNPCGAWRRGPAAPAPRGLTLRRVDRRIFGLENEYGVTCTLRGQRRLSPDEVARYLFRRVVSWGRSSNVFLENGARLYLDVGSHPEYATPECDSVLDVV